MEKAFIVVTTSRSRGIPRTKLQCIDKEENVIDMAKGFTNDERKIERIFSIDELGREIKFYQIIFDGHLKLIEKIN